MRTESDLRNAFDRIAAVAPESNLAVEELPVPSAERRPVRRRRTAFVLVTVTATAAAAVGVRVAIDNLHEASVAQSGNAWENWVTLTAPAGMIVNPRAYEANRQIYQLAGVGSPWSKWCLLTLHRNGDFDPGKIPADSPRIDLNGLSGRLVTMPDGEPITSFPPGYAMSFGRTARPVTTVAWQPAKGVWALLSCEAQRHLGTLKVPTIDAPSDSDPKTAIAVAKTIKATSQRLASPFKVGYVPAGLRPLRVQDRSANFPGDGHSFSIVFTDGNPTTGENNLQPVWSGDKTHPAPEGFVTGSVWGPPPMPGEDLEIRYSTDKFWNQMTRLSKENPPDLTIHGYRAWYTTDGWATDATSGKPAPATILRLERNGVAITVRTFDTPVNKAALRKIAESLTLPKNPLDTNQWYDAATALPH